MTNPPPTPDDPRDPGIKPPPGVTPTLPGPAPLAALTTPLPGARLALVLLLTINLFNYIDRQILAANLAPIEQRLLPDPKLQPVEALANKEWLGYLALAFMVSYMILAPLFGWLADRLQRWKIVGVGVILWSLASGASGLPASAGWFGGLSPIIGTFTFLLLTRCFVGVGEAAYGPVAPTVISDLYPVKVRGSVLAWFYAAIPVGGALGYAFGGLAGWPWAFYLVVPPGLLLGVWCFLMPEPRRGGTDLHPWQSVRKPTWRDSLTLLYTPSYVIDCLGMTAMTFAIGGIAYFMPLYIEQYKGVQGLEKINLIFGAIVVVSGLSATLLGGIVGDLLRPRFSGSYFLVSGLAMLASFPLILGVIYTPAPWFWVFIFLACFGLFFNTGPTNTILANVTHPAVRAQAFALNILVIHLFGDAVSPWIIGLIARYSAEMRGMSQPDMDTGFIVVSVLVLVGGLVWLAGTPFLGRDTDRAPERLNS
jgi:MFS family permease